MNRIFFSSFLLVSLVLNCSRVYSQFLGDGHNGGLTPSGTVTMAAADYSDLTATASVGATTITVSSAAGFAVNDYIMIMQMVGTGVGNYEIRSITNIASNTLTVFPLVNTYTKSGSASVAQAILMRQYSNVSVTAGNTLTAPAWNGTTGGVLAFYANGTVTVSGTGDVNMNGKGFSGGAAATVGSGPNGGALNTGGTNGTPVAGGTPAKFATMQMGSGGGGGSAPATGSTGGFGNAGGFSGCSGGGTGGGGGGGSAGAAGTGSGGTGGAGGGIIFIVCNAITNSGSGGTIRANGATGTNGGGAGGTGGAGGIGGQGGNAFVRTDILYRGAAFPSCGCFCPADNFYPNCPNICFYTAGTGGSGGIGGTGGTGSGGGGAGAGGVVFIGTNLNTGPVPTVTGGSATTGGSGGAAGAAGSAGPGGNSADCSSCTVTANTCGNCSASGSAGSAGSAGAAGASGAAGTAGGVGKTSTNGGVPLPVKLITFVGINSRDVNILRWTTATEMNNNYFSVERSSDGNNWTEIARTPGAGNSNTALSYTITDEEPISPISYYRLKQVDFNGGFAYCGVVPVYTGEGSSDVRLMPNPAKDMVTIILSSDEEGVAEVKIYELSGKLTDRKLVDLIPGNNAALLDIAKLDRGAYTVRIFQNGKLYSGKLIKE